VATFEPGCGLCALSRSGDLVDGVVVETGHWQLTNLPGYELPGCYCLQTKRHVHELAELGADALAELGPRLAEVTATIRRVVGCDKVYVQRFGETYQHWHLLVCARPDDVPPSLHGPRFLLDRRPWLDEDRSREVAGMVRSELAHWGTG